MGPVYGLHVLENCLTCPARGEHFFCNLSVGALQCLNEIKAAAVYPKRAILFMEGQQPRGVFVLCAGHAKLSTSSFPGKTIITKVSESGDVLGLNAVVANRPYEVTAEMTEPGQANFIPRDSLLQFRQDHGEVAWRVAEQLSRDYYTAYEEIRILGLTRSPSEKFAKLLLSWWTKAAQNDRATKVRLTLTPRGHCGDHRHHPRDCQPPVFQVQEETVAAAKGEDPHDSQPEGPRKDRAQMGFLRLCNQLISPLQNVIWKASFLFEMCEERMLISGRSPAASTRLVGRYTHRQDFFTA